MPVVHCYVTKTYVPSVYIERAFQRTLGKPRARPEGAEPLEFLVLLAMQLAFECIAQVFPAPASAPVVAEFQYPVDKRKTFVLMMGHHLILNFGRMHFSIAKYTFCTTNAFRF